MNFLTSLNLNKNELQNAVIQNLAVAPSSPKVGQVYFNTTTDAYMGWDGTAWVKLSLSDLEFRKLHTQNTDTGTTSATFHIGSGANGPKLKNVAGKLEVKDNADTAYGNFQAGNITGSSVTSTGNLTVGNHGETVTQMRNKRVSISTSGRSTDPNADLNNVFEIKDSSTTPVNLFEVRQNGDTIIGGSLKVSGDINGGGEGGGGVGMEGDVHIKGNLDVDGNTQLGNNSAEDSTTIKGYTKIENRFNKVAIQTAVDQKIAAWKLANPDFLPSELNEYRNGPASAGAGKSLAADLADYVDVFALVDVNQKEIFQVKPNGDTIIAGVLSVNGSGESYFEGDVNINGNLVVEGDATIKGIMQGDDFTLTGNLRVQGNTELGDNVAEDFTIIKGKTEVLSKFNKDEINAALVAAKLDKYTNWKTIAGNANKTVDEYTAAKRAFTGGGYNQYAFAVKDVTNKNLFEVKGNGDTVIAGVIEVNGEGDSVFQGNVNIGGNLVVDGNITNGTEVEIGEDLHVKGTLRVDGQTFLGDSIAQDSLLIKARTKIDATGLAANTKVFEIVKDNKSLFDVDSDGDVVIGGNLKVTKDAIVSADMTGNNMTVKGNLNVQGNTILGDNKAVDTVVVNAQYLDMGGSRITDVGAPQHDTDAVNKAYVDSARAGLMVKDPVRVATTAKLVCTMSRKVLTASANGALVIDGVTLVVGDRVLVKNQTAKTQNGIYTVTNIGGASAKWVLTRSWDADNEPTPNHEVKAGMCTWVNEGTLNQDSRWVLVTNDTINLGTTELVFTKDFQGKDLTVTANKGLSKVGNTLSGVKFTGCTSSAAGKMGMVPAPAAGNQNKFLRGDGTWVDSGDMEGSHGQKHSMTSTADHSATANRTFYSDATGNVRELAHGASGQVLRSNGPAAAPSWATPIRKHAQDVGNGTATEFTIAHNLGTQDVIITIREKAAPGEVVFTDIQILDANNVKLLFGTAPASAEYRVTVVG